MSNYNKKSKWKKFLHSPLFLIIFFVIIVFFTGTVYDLYQKNKEITVSKNKSLHELNTLKEKENTLKTELDSLGTDRGIEETIREKYRVVKNGEELIVIPEDKMPASAGAASDPIPTQTEEKKSSFWSFMKEWFATK